MIPQISRVVRAIERWTPLCLTARTPNAEPDPPPAAKPRLPTEAMVRKARRPAVSLRAPADLRTRLERNSAPSEKARTGPAVHAGPAMTAPAQLYLRHRLLQAVINLPTAGAGPRLCGLRGKSDRPPFSSSTVDPSQPSNAASIQRSRIFLRALAGFSFRPPSFCE